MKKNKSMVLIAFLSLSITLSGCSASKSVNETATKGQEDTNKQTEATTENTTVEPIEDGTKTVTVDEGNQESEAKDSNTQSQDEIGFPDEYTTPDGCITPDGYTTSNGYTNSDEYSKIIENGFKNTMDNPLSTFSIDVDTASYTNMRKNINYGVVPDRDSVRIEEMLNYFSYDYEMPSKDKPFSITTEIGACPWNEQSYLLTVGLQGRNVDLENLPKSNLVFLIDVSGSMEEEDKLPLLKNAFTQLIDHLGENDKVSIVVYAGSSGTILDGVRGNEKEIIVDALDSLTAGGSTAGAEGIERAYELAEENYIKNGNNRVILATDGDFNVGASSEEELEEIIQAKRDNGIFLSVIGFGSGNLKDNKMELLADQGNGNYAYIDSPKEAKKVLVDEMSGTLLTIAKDVKIQLEFNPYSVESYRLIGYENRALEDEDFNDDTVDAGELGAGHNVTAIYEIFPTTSTNTVKNMDKDLKYQSQNTHLNEDYLNEIVEVRLRYKDPKAEKSKEICKVVSYESVVKRGKKLTDDFYFAAAVAEFGMICRDSEYKGSATIESLLELAENGLGEDEGGYRSEFINMVEDYRELNNN